MQPEDPMDKAMDKMSVAPAPEEDGTRAPVFSADAGTDHSIVERLHRDPSNKDARLDRALDESMDASDPPSSTQPIHNTYEPPVSSGYDPKAEAKLAAGNGGDKPGVIGKIARALGIG